MTTTSASTQFLIISTPNHPFYPLFQDNWKGQLFSFSLDPKFLASWVPGEKMFSTYQAIWDFTLFPSLENKNAFLNKVVTHSSLPLMVESCCYWGESLLLQYPSIQGLFSTGFFSPQKKREVFFRPSLPNSIQSTQSAQSPLSPKESFLKFLNNLGYDGLEVSSPGLGFIFPRTLSLIINEAFLALEENLSPPEHMDEAMKYGVNHPLGPIEWCQKIGAEKVVLLLDQLFQVTSDSRYQVSPLLRLEAQKEWLRFQKSSFPEV